MIHFETRFLICAGKKRFITPLMGFDASDFHLFPIFIRPRPSGRSFSRKKFSIELAWRASYLMKLIKHHYNAMSNPSNIYFVHPRTRHTSISPLSDDDLNAAAIKPVNDASRNMEMSSCSSRVRSLFALNTFLVIEFEDTAQNA